MKAILVSLAVAIATWIISAIALTLAFGLMGGNGQNAFGGFFGGLCLATVAGPVAYWIMKGKGRFPPV